jgi:hypothetical protein
MLIKCLKEIYSKVHIEKNICGAFFQNALILCDDFSQLLSSFALEYTITEA